MPTFTLQIRTPAAGYDVVDNDQGKLSTYSDAIIVNTDSNVFSSAAYRSALDVYREQTAGTNPSYDQYLTYLIDLLPQFGVNTTAEDFTQQHGPTFPAGSFVFFGHTWSSSPGGKDFDVMEVLLLDPEKLTSQINYVAPVYGFIGDIPDAGEPFQVMHNTHQAGYLPDKPPISFDISRYMLAPCFTAGTFIETDRGDIAIEALRIGDLVKTIDNGLQPIRWIGSSRICSNALSSNTKLRPIQISADALGAGVPAHDLVVSPQHRVLIRSKISDRMFGAAEVLVPAVKLTALPGIFTDNSCDPVEYFHILFDQHEMVRSNGAITETLHTGPIALRSLSSAARAEIFAIFPELAALGVPRPLARSTPAGKDAAALIARHLKNQKPVQIGL
ncbi:Hint domain-containing protein [Ketogulonicigenium vulgare]|uniref:Type I secretion target repeat protein n=1 Tax=Ketogulonicigenium vulgare (strain WSH-001) TaxID=759362 RepID=F9Y9P2_KETVW|nr:Hint domain-containing protein [Ketogulonicigenium vulgare]ADO41330.1 hemolysin-type calcium-binding region [Ketogulonicigenium vulgare Y25]AEM41380.1 Type I secretion target repeat protein [Ketogulonicigenium vulgare WSH-001]ALJ81517.1 type I secretion protein [Ketogulonicigenium vulgare]ANW34224.1 type I secretion protein [Ketogulonicigenium vulgare]AOZ55125.1 hemolysin-type calcium-binding region [Ketogulonicigenium vulgare]